MRAIVEELESERRREHVVRIEHRERDRGGLCAEGRVVESIRVRRRLFEQSDDEPHDRREATGAERGSQDRATHAADVCAARDAAGTQSLDVTSPRDDRPSGSDSLFELPTKGAANGRTDN